MHDRTNEMKEQIRRRTEEDKKERVVQKEWKAKGGELRVLRGKRLRTEE